MFCQNCGANIDDKAKICPNCGVSTKPKKKPIYKRWWFWLLIVVFLFVIIGIASSGRDSQSNQNTSDIVAEKDSAVSGKIGKYVVTVKESRITEDFEGKKVVVVTYSFTNNSDDSATFTNEFIDSAFQNGVELEHSYDSDIKNIDNQDKKIKPGVTIDVPIAYVLSDEKTDVEVQIEEFMSFNDTKLNYNIKIK